MTERIITDAKGDDWQVTNVRRALAHGAETGYHLTPSWLCFAHADGRRVRVERELFAGDWRRLSVADLKAMLATALISPKPIRE